MYQKSVLPNGIRVVSEAIPYVKSVTLGVWVGTGSRSEQQHNHGISHFIEHLLFKGTTSRSAKDIAEVVDEVGGQLNAFTAKEYTCYYIKVVDTHMELAIDILSDMLINSRFDPEDIAREREVVLEEVKMYEDSPDELVHDIHLDRNWSGHALGRNILGTAESISAFDRSLVLDYYHDFYTPDNMVVAAAGNLSHELLVELTDRFFSKLASKKAAVVHPVPLLTPTRIFQAKDTEQVNLCLGTVSVAQNAPEIYPVHILNNILGGGISSRLFQSIREERGLAYSVYSYQTNYSDAGLLTVYAGTRPANTEQVIQLILAEISKLKKAGITEKELTRAKEQIKGSLLLGLESSSSRMSRIGKMEITLGKFITLDEVVEKIEQVTVPTIQSITEQLFRPETFCFTALGPVDEKVLPSDITF
ncbi:pitrilysin family protein [Anaerospora sp.]|uniref:M16 family metallopeptidase n=1 Tax=Anaerospora sp. TaxID=1960278 RepID=UPI002897E728|nr:pitrilysin family protein [Anaerospora sp.]